MRKLLIRLFVVATLASCGKNKDGTQLAKEVCDCFEYKGDDCLEIYYRSEKKVMNNKKKAEEFYKAMKECTMYLIKLPR